MSRKVSLTNDEQDYLRELVERDKKGRPLHPYPGLVEKLTRPLSLEEAKQNAKGGKAD